MVYGTFVGVSKGVWHTPSQNIVWVGVGVCRNRRKEYEDIKRDGNSN